MVKIILNIVSPEKLLFSEEVDCVVVPGSDGELGILPGHAELVTTLKSGNIKFTKRHEVTNVPLNSGFLEVSNNEVTILSI